MFKNILPVLWGLGLLLAIGACKTTKTTTTTTTTIPEDSSPALLSFKEGTVTKAEFERVYAKNNGGKETAAAQATDEYREYLDLYVNFKRKVFEAESVGLDTTEAFKQEFETYRKQLVQPYLSAKEVEDQLVKEAYDRSGMLVSASHILIMVNEDAGPEDTLAAYNKVKDLRDSVVVHGKDFADLAALYSQDPSAKENSGALGYFSAFDMVYPFENAAFNTTVGEVSEPLRTRFGYHILKVNDKITREGTKTVAHIIVRVGDRYSAKTEDQAVEIVKEIYQKLQNGEAFATLAQQYSDDPNSANNGGDLGSGRLLPVMEELKNKMGEGEFSEPFQTRFGWHILAVTEVETRPAFDEAKAGLKQKIQRDSRAQVSRTALIERIKDESNYAINTANLDAFKAQLNDNFPKGLWQVDTAQQPLYALPLITFGGTQSRSIQDFIDFYKKTRARRPRMTPQQAADDILKIYSEQQLLAYEEEQLPLKNPAFRHLLQEYRDGILLFTLMEQKVWKRAVEDTTGLKNYYEAHQDSFYKNDIIEAKEYIATEKAVLEQVQEWLAAGWADAQIDSAMREGSALKLRIIRQTFEKEGEGTQAAWFNLAEGERSAIFNEGETFRILEVEAKRPAGIQAFDKVKSEAITRYQDYLEKEWLAELAQKYPVEIQENVFTNLFK
ncbi:MAG: peptidylprolyl isomerase [Bacteroidia bacterium]